MSYSLSGAGRPAEHEAILAEDRRQVLAALARLPRRRREVLVLRTGHRPGLVNTP